jgi:DNA-binding MarR family transcriptional regulator
VTSSGNETVERALTILSEKFDEWLVRLDDQERSELQRLLEKLLS